MNVTQIQGAAGGSLTLRTQVGVSLTELQMSTDSRIAFLTTATLSQGDRELWRSITNVWSRQKIQAMTGLQCGLGWADGQIDRWMDGVRGSEMHPEVEK